ncbi:MAG: phosphotransferase enzyme family protein [Pleurocapsa sp.]
MTNNLWHIAHCFNCEGKIKDIQVYGSGNINRTYLVTIDAALEAYFILQCLNTEVFKQPHLVMDNIEIVTNHLNHKLQQIDLSGDRCWYTPRVLLTSEGKNYYRDSNNLFWRAITFIPNSQSFDTIQNNHHAAEIGYGLGMFHNLTSDLAVDSLADTLPGFHITPSYLNEYEQVIAKIQLTNSPEINYCLQAINNCWELADILETAKIENKLPLRTIHGDPKINNIMFDCDTNQAISVIDLDTVKPGLIHYDLGDCLRSGCNPWGEETLEWEQVSFVPEYAQSILQGYVAVAEFLTQSDRDYIYDSIRLLSFELGLRFFTDYLRGNTYFKADYPQHNLARALVQFKLTESIESQASTMQKIIRDLP